MTADRNAGSGPDNHPAEGLEDFPNGLDSGAFIGSEPELGDESGDATLESSGPGAQGANPDEGWRDGPAGHREGRPADDDLLRRKG